jgi:hypothetical protein
MVGTLLTMMFYGKQSFGKALGWWLLTLMGTFLISLIVPANLSFLIIIIQYMVGWAFVKGFLKQDPKQIGGKNGTGYFNIYLLGEAFNVIFVIILIVVIGLSASAILSFLGMSGAQ